MILAILIAAAAAPESGALGSWVSIALIILGGICALINIGSIYTTRREMSVIKEEVDRRLKENSETHAKHEQVHKDLFSKIGGVERGAKADDQAAQAALRTETYKLHEKINGVDRTVASIETETRLQSKTLGAIAAKLSITP